MLEVDNEQLRKWLDRDAKVLSGVAKYVNRELDHLDECDNKDTPYTCTCHQEHAVNDKFPHLAPPKRPHDVTAAFLSTFDHSKLREKYLAMVAPSHADAFSVTGLYRLMRMPSRRAANIIG